MSEEPTVHQDIEALLLYLATGTPTKGSSGHCADCCASHHDSKDYEWDTDSRTRLVLDIETDRFGLSPYLVETHYGGCVVNDARKLLDRLGVKWSKAEVVP